VMLIFSWLTTGAALMAAKLPAFQTFIDYWVNTLFQPFS